MSAGYALLVNEDDQWMGAPAAAELLGVSVDTVRAMIRSSELPARLERGRYRLYRPDVEKARVKRVGSTRADYVQLSDEDRAALHEVRKAEEQAVDAWKAARARRAKLVVELSRLRRGTGAMADALGVHRATVQDDLREARVPTFHHRQAVPLTGDEQVALREVQAGVVEALDGIDKAAQAREELTRRLLERGGYGVAMAIAHELGRHRSRLLNPRPPRRPRR